MVSQDPFVAARQAGAVPPGVDPTLWERVQQQVRDFRTNTTNSVRNFSNATVDNPGNTPSGRFGANVAGKSRGFANAMTSGTAMGIGGFGAGLATAMSGGGLAETLGSGGGAAGGIALAGKLAQSLGKAGGPWGGLLAAGATIAVPMLTQAIGSNIGRGLDNGLLANVGGAMQRGGQANINRALDPTNSLGAIIDNATSGMSKQSREYAELLKRMGYDSQDVAAYGVQKVAIPLMNHQANLRAKMLPLDTAARLAQQSNQNIGQMFNTSIAGTSNIAAQIAANNPYGQVMI